MREDGDENKKGTEEDELLAFPLDRVVWLPQLDAEQYQAMLTHGDAMIDPFPFGGGVTTLEGLGVCLPVVTAPSLQTVPALAAGMVESLTVPWTLRKRLVAANADDLVKKTVALLTDRALNTKVRRELCDSFSRPPKKKKRAIGGVFNDTQSIKEWQNVLARLARSADLR
jgi:hypothetical protein